MSEWSGYDDLLRARSPTYRRIAAEDQSHRRGDEAKCHAAALGAVGLTYRGFKTIPVPKAFSPAAVVFFDYCLGEFVAVSHWTVAHLGAAVEQLAPRLDDGRFAPLGSRLSLRQRVRAYLEWRKTDGLGFHAGITPIGAVAKLLGAMHASACYDDGPEEMNTGWGRWLDVAKEASRSPR